MRSITSIAGRFVLLSLVMFAGCGRSELTDPNELPTFPVTGKVMVDGKPVAMIRVVAHDAAEPPRPFNEPKGFTKDDGSFSLTTFRDGDGVPAGEYNLTFQYGTMAMVMGRQYQGDKFKGKYMKAAESKFKLTVTEGQPTDLGTIELTTGTGKSK